MKRQAGGRTDRRTFLAQMGTAAAAAAATPWLLTAVGRGSADEAAAQVKQLSFYSWTYGVSRIKQLIEQFEKKTGIKLEYGNTPGAQYRDALIPKFVSGAPLHVMYQLDFHLAEFADAGWLAPIEGLPNVDAYKKDFVGPALDAMTYKGKLYGLCYYTDYMAFLYNQDLLQKAGIKAPPTTWEEVTKQALAIKQKRLTEYPVLLTLAAEIWFLEQIYAQVYARGGHIFDEKLEPADLVRPKSPVEDTFQWIVDALHKHKIVSGSILETAEVEAFKAFSNGGYAFAILPKYRLQALNDPAQSKIAGNAKMALMPKAMSGIHETCAWTRLYSMTTQAAQDKALAQASWKLIEFLGGKNEQGVYEVPKGWFLEFGLGFANRPLFQDADIVQQCHHSSLLLCSLSLRERAGGRVPKEPVKSPSP